MKLNDIIEELRHTFVTLETFNLRFSPIEKIVYGFTSIILVTVATALIYLVVRK
jgi:cell division protein FtsL